MNDNLRHVMKDDCTDPDCEIHNPEVGFAEQTVTETDLAFFLAGANTMLNLIDAAYTANGNVYNSTVLASAISELRDQHIPVEVHNG